MSRKPVPAQAGDRSRVELVFDKPQTLAALFGLVAFLFAMMGVIDLARSRVMARVAMRFQDRLESRVFQAALQDGALTGQQAAAQGGLRDLEAVRQ